MKTKNLSLAEAHEGDVLIPLTKGHAALVSIEDLPTVLEHSWMYEDGYAKVSLTVAYKKKKWHPMQNHIMKPLPGMVVDHINGNCLDNRRSNLRLCTRAENATNRKLTAANKSGFIGVAKDRECWVARLNVDGQRIHVGSFKCKYDAATAYNFAIAQHDRPLAKRNTTPQPWLEGNT